MSEADRQETDDHQADGSRHCIRKWGSAGQPPCGTMPTVWDPCCAGATELNCPQKMSSDGAYQDPSEKIWWEGNER